MKNVPTYNIVGEIPGKRPERMILLSAHYDSYFSGFQDDNTAIAMMLGIARAYLKIGYQPENTWVFCGMAAEEWGKCDTKYDWSTGAYQEIFKVHPDWAERSSETSTLSFRPSPTEIWTASAVPTSTGISWRSA